MQQAVVEIDKKSQEKKEAIMQFIDRTRVIVKAGDGGHGKSAFRRTAVTADAAATSSSSWTRT